jgi:hypothetical protein
VQPRRPVHQGGDPSHQGRGRGGARTARKGRCIWHRLSDAGRYLHPGLYSLSDLVAAHSAALAYLRGGGASTTLNCGYGRGFSVLEADLRGSPAAGRAIPRKKLAGEWVRFRKVPLARANPGLGWRGLLLDNGIFERSIIDRRPITWPSRDRQQDDLGSRSSGRRLRGRAFRSVRRQEPA